MAHLDLRAAKEAKKAVPPLPPEALREAVVVSASMVRQDLVGTHLRLGKLYYEHGLMRDAAGEFQTVMNLGPLQSEAREAKSLLEGISDFVDPPQEERIRVYLEVGAALFQRNDLENAKLQYKKVLLLEPGADVAHKNLAYVYLKEKKEGEAWSHLNEALRVAPDSAESLVLKAYILARRRNFRDAEKTFLRVAGLVQPGTRMGRYATEMAEKMALFTDLR